MIKDFTDKHITFKILILRNNSVKLDHELTQNMLLDPNSYDALQVKL